MINKINEIITKSKIQKNDRTNYTLLDVIVVRNKLDIKAFDNESKDKRKGIVKRALSKEPKDVIEYNDVDKSVLLKSLLIKKADHRERDFSNTVAFSKRLFKLVDNYIKEVDRIYSLGGSKSYPVLVVKGDDGLGKLTLVNFIQKELDIKNKSINCVKKIDDSMELALFDNFELFQNAVQERKKNVLYVMVDETYKPTFEDMVKLSRLDLMLLTKNNDYSFLDKSYSYIIDIDYEDYKDPELANDLIISLLDKHECSRDLSLKVDTFAEKLIPVYPRNLDNLFFKLKDKANALEVKFNTDFIKKCIEEIFVKEKENNIVQVIDPSKTMTDIVISKNNQEELQSIFSWAKNKDKGDKKFYQKLQSKNNRLVCLFSGEPGTGKSLSAEVLAKELGKKLWNVDISRIYDKWLGETEKHLTLLFQMAEQAKAVLRIDEADAFISARSQFDQDHTIRTKNHLLNLIESYNGILILTTNRIESIDKAFNRRINFKVEFDLPNKDEMILILKSMFEPDAPLAKGFDYNKAIMGVESVSGGYLKLAVERVWIECVQSKIKEISEEMVNKAIKKVIKENKLSAKTKRIGINNGGATED